MKRFNPFRFMGRRLLSRHETNGNATNDNNNNNNNSSNNENNATDEMTATPNENADETNENHSSHSSEIQQNEEETQTEEMETISVQNSNSSPSPPSNPHQMPQEKQNVLVVVKIYPKHLIVSRLACILKEIELHVSCRHVNIVNFYGTSRDVSNVYFVMEMCPNGSLFHLSQKYESHIPLEMVRHYAAEMVNLLEFMHKKSVILYRSFDVRKLLLDSKNHIKLSSFRRAIPMDTMNEARQEVEKRMFEEDIQFNTKKSSKEITAKNCLPLFSPTVFSLVTPKIDFWTLGGIIVFLLTGRTPLPPLDPSTGTHRYDMLGEYCYDEIEDPQILDFLNLLWNIGSSGILPSKSEEEGNKKKEVDLSHIVEIKKHPFFQGIQFEGLETSIPPRIPRTLKTICVEYLKQNSRKYWDDSFQWEAKLPMDLLNKLFYQDLSNLVEQRQAKYLKKGENVVKWGTVWHTNFFKWKFRAKLVLTNLPRFIVVDIEKNKKIDEFSWNCSALEEGGVPVVMMEVTTNGSNTFSIAKMEKKKGLQRKFVLDSQDANEWVEAVYQSGNTSLHSQSVAKGVLEPL